MNVVCCSCDWRFEVEVVWKGLALCVSAVLSRKKMNSRWLPCAKESFQNKAYFQGTSCFLQEVIPIQKEGKYENRNFRVALWPSTWEEVNSWLSASLVLLCVASLFLFSYFLFRAECGKQNCRFIIVPASSVLRSRSAFPFFISYTLPMLRIRRGKKDNFGVISHICPLKHIF